MTFDINNSAYNRFASGYQALTRTAAQAPEKTGKTQKARGINAGPSLVMGLARKNILALPAALDPALFPQANFTAQERDMKCISLFEKLGQIHGKRSGKAILCDIYTVMDLMQEVAQKMRNAMREMRKTENLMIFGNIKRQAQIQRNAAICSAIAGGVLCLLQAGAMVFGIRSQIKGLRTQIKLQGLSGQKMAQQQVDMTSNGNSTAKTNAQLQKVLGRTPTEIQKDPMVQKNTLQKADEVNAAHSRLAKAQDGLANLKNDKSNGLAKKVGDLEQRLKAVDGKLGKAQADLSAAKDQVTTAEKDLQSLKNELSAPNRQNPPVGQDGRMAEGGPTSLEREIDARARIQRGRFSKNQLPKEIDGLKAEKTKLQGQLDAARKEFEASPEFKKAQTELDAAQANYNEKVEAKPGNVGFDEKAEANAIHEAALQDVDNCKASFDSVRRQLIDREELLASGKQKGPDGKTIKIDKKAVRAEIKTLRKELDVASKRFELARAQQMNISSHLKLDASTYRQVHAMATGDLKSTMNAQDTTGIAIKSQVSGMKGMFFQQLAMSLGQYAQSVVQSIKEIQNSKATELQADQKISEELLDQIKDIFQQYQQMIAKTIDLFRSVIEKESQSIEETIRA